MPLRIVRAALAAALLAATNACQRTPPQPHPPPPAAAARPAAPRPPPPTDTPTPPAVARPLPSVDATRLSSTLRASNQRVRSQVPADEMYCGGSAGYGCLDAIVAGRTAAIDAIGRLVARSASLTDDATACRVRGELGPLLAILQNGREQAAGGPDPSDETDGYCDCMLPAVALPPELADLASALAARCPAPDTTCRVTMPVAFHLRPGEEAASTGRALPAGNAIDLLANGTIVRRGERMYLVALASDGTVGYTFVAPSQVPAGCHLPGP